MTPKLIPRYDMGDLAGLLPSVRPQIIEVIAGQPAEAAGFRPGDEIRSVDGRPVLDSQAFIDAISPRGRPAGRGPGGARRPPAGAHRRRRATTAAPAGSASRSASSSASARRGRSSRACATTCRRSQEIFQILGKIFSRELSAKGAFAGPLEIAEQSGAAARMGFKYLLQLMGFISISIAMMNLMPIPILDGGQIFILLVEGVIRRDLSLRLKEVISQVGFVMILLLMFVVIWIRLHEETTS